MLVKTVVENKRGRERERGDRFTKIEGCLWVDINKVSVSKEKKGGGGIVCMLHFDRLGQAELYNFMNFKKKCASPHTKKIWRRIKKWC